MNRKKNTTITCIAALCLLSGSAGALAGPGGGGDEQQGQQSRDSNSNTHTTQRSNRDRQSIQGTIESVQQANWIGKGGAHEQRDIIRLQMRDGRTEFVDVGSHAKFRELHLSAGDRIRAQGHRTMINERPVFFADRIRVNGETFSVQRNGDRRPQNAAFAQADSTNRQQTRTVQGTIEGFRHVYLRPQQGQRQQHSLVKLNLRNGRSLTVDLGAKKDLDDLDLQQGDRITLRGRNGKVDGRSVFFADQIRVGGQTIQIARTVNRGEQNQATASSNTQANSDQTFTLQGRVAGYQVITLQSGQKQVSLLNLALEDGRSVLIDAGSKRSDLDLKQLDLRDKAVIEGHTEKIQGRTVLVADNIQFMTPSQNPDSGVGRSGQAQHSSGGGSSADQNDSTGSEQNAKSNSANE